VQFVSRYTRETAFSDCPATKAEYRRRLNGEQPNIHGTSHEKKKRKEEPPFKLKIADMWHTNF
jgi:hypothetical protein